MLNNLKIKNLRAITELEIDNFGQVNLITGENNCGKTTILESLFFLAGATNPNLPVTANTLRGFPFLSDQMWLTFFHNMKQDCKIKISGERLYDDENEKWNLHKRICRIYIFQE